MKQHKNTDRIIKEKMEYHEMDAPMHLFDGIADAVNNEAVPGPSKEKNPLRHGYWLLALLTLILAGSGIWYTNANNTSTISANQKLSTIPTENSNTEILNQETKVENSFNESNKTPHTLLNENTISETASNSNNVNTTIQEESLVSDLNISKKSNHQIDNIENADLSDNVIGNTTLAATVSNSFSTTIQNTNRNTTSDNNLASQNDLTSKGGNQNATNVPSKYFNGKNNSTSTARPVAAQLVDYNSKTSSLLENSSSSLNSTANESVIFLPQLKNSKKLLEDKAPFELNVEPKCGIKSDGSKVKFTTSVDVFFSPDYASQILEYKTIDFRDYAKMRKESERPFYSFNTGVRVNFLTEYGWAIRTGIAYTQINEIIKTEHLETTLVIDVTTGDTLDSRQGIRDVNNLNKYRMIDIPLILGYEVPMKKFTLNVNGGVYLNLMSEQSGRFFSPLEDKVVHFTEGHADNYDVFKDNIGLSVFVGLGFNFDLNEKTQLIVEPHTRYYPRSFTLDSYILNQKYFTTGVMLGLRRDL